MIDDDKLIRWSITTVLGRAGYQVREAATAAEGLTAVESIAPNVVLLDINLPDADGFAVLEAIRHAHPELPALTMTADASPETARRALRLGARRHLEKPCDSAVLLAAVSESLQSNTSLRQINQ